MPAATPKRRWTCCAIFSTPKFSALPCRIWPACGQVEALSDELSALADTILAAAIPCVWADTPKTHTDTPQIGIIGYGKLGGKELGYTSDLDLVYVYDDPHPDAPRYLQAASPAASPAGSPPPPVPARSTMLICACAQRRFGLSRLLRGRF